MSPPEETSPARRWPGLFNIATEGIHVKLAFHICFGNRYGRARFNRSYGNYFPGVLEARTHQFVLEFASREMAEIERWKDWNDGRELGAGLIDVKSFYPETPEDVAQRIRRVLQYADAEKVYINPDCGFGWSPRYIAVAKLKAMVAGTPHCSGLANRITSFYALRSLGVRDIDTLLTAPIPEI